MKISCSRFLWIGSLFLLLVLKTNALVLGGSDLLAGPIEKAIVQELDTMGLDVTLDLQGSLLGQKALEAGNIEACILAIPDIHDAPKAYRQYPVAFQIVAFAVHDSNPVQEVSYPQLVRLFGNDNVIENWSGLTDSLTWADRKVLLHATRSDKLITLELFNAQVLEGKPFRESLKISKASPDEFVETIRLDSTAMLMVPYMLPKGPMRFLDVKAGEEDQSYNPSPENVFYGDYPLRLPFYLVVSESLEPGKIKALLQAILSPAVSQAMVKNNFVALPDQESRELLSRFD